MVKRSQHLTQVFCLPTGSIGYQKSTEAENAFQRCQVVVQFLFCFYRDQCQVGAFRGIDISGSPQGEDAEPPEALVESKGLSQVGVFGSDADDTVL